MAEINVNKDELKQQIASLNKLAQSLEGKSVKSPSAGKGSGSAQRAAISLLKEYKSLNDSLQRLITNSAVFYQNVLNSMSQADKKAAQGIQGK